MTTFTKHTTMIEEEEKETINEIDLEKGFTDSNLTQPLMNPKEVVIAADKKIKANYYLRGNPVSLYCTNIDVLMGGRANIWGGGRNSPGITDRNGSPIPRQVFKDNVAYNDGKLEFATFDSLIHVILSKSKRVLQAEGPFEFHFKDDRYTRTYINIDGEFYQLENIRSINIVKNRSLKILVNERDEIFD